MEGSLCLENFFMQFIFASLNYFFRKKVELERNTKLEMSWADIFTTRITHSPSHPTRNQLVTGGICQICNSWPVAFVKFANRKRKNSFSKMLPQNVKQLKKLPHQKYKDLRSWLDHDRSFDFITGWILYILRSEIATIGWYIEIMSSTCQFDVKIYRWPNINLLVGPTLVLLSVDPTSITSISQRWIHGRRKRGVGGAVLPSWIFIHGTNIVKA